MSEDTGRDAIELSIVMPCLNEARTLGTCIAKAKGFLDANFIVGEIVIGDNGSTDGSQAIARGLGARVVDVPVRGYGAALQGGIHAARGRFVIMGDADDSYDFTDLMPFVERLRAGDDLVMGNRFRGGIRPGAMPPLHRYLGNPVLSTIGRVLFHNTGCRDFHCGLRGFRREAILALDLQTTGMEFASEMVLKAALHSLRVSEVPTTLSPDGRDRPPHLRTWRDGWRHLRFMFLYSPAWLFLYPGLFLMGLGVVVGTLVLAGPVQVLGVGLDIHTLLYAAAAVIVGYQLVTFAVFTRIFALIEGLIPSRGAGFERVRRLFQHVTLEAGVLTGLGLILCGILLSFFAFNLWGIRAYGELDPREAMRWVIPAVTLLALGAQTVFASFFLSILGLSRKSYSPHGVQRQK